MCHDVLFNCMICKNVFLSAKRETVPEGPRSLSWNPQRSAIIPATSSSTSTFCCSVFRIHTVSAFMIQGMADLSLNFRSLLRASALPPANPFKRVFAPCLAAGAFVQIHSASLEEQVELESLRHRVTMSDFCSCLVIQSGGFPRGPTGAAGVSKIEDSTGVQ